MTITKFIPFNDSDADEVNSNFAQSWSFNILNKIRQTIDRASVDSSGQDDIFSDAYVDVDGQNNTFSNGTALFDTNKYKASTSSTEPYIIIVATSINESAFNINNCQIAEINSGTWLLSCSTGTDEVKRAQLYKTLFYDGIIGTTYVTGLTALKTTITRDIGKRGYYGEAILTTPFTASTASSAKLEFTFDDTVNNTDFSSWSKVHSETVGTFNLSDLSTYVLSTATINSVTVAPSGNQTIDETGTDKTGDEEDNPSTATYVYQLGGEDGGSDTAFGSADVYFLAYGSVSAAETLVSTGTATTFIDYFTDESVPALTAVTEDFVSMIVHDIAAGTYPATVSKLIGKVLYEDWENGVTIYHKIQNATEDSGWILDGVFDTFTAFTSQPTKYLIKLVPKTSPTANYPSIRGFGMYCE